MTVTVSRWDGGGVIVKSTGVQMMLETSFITSLGLSAGL